MVYMILDPHGFHHTLQNDLSRWCGYENIAHHAEPSARQGIIEQVLFSLSNNLPLPEGYRRAS